MKKNFLRSISLMVIMIFISSKILVAQITISAEITNIQCFGETDGSIDIDVSDGTPSYTYLWSDFSSNEDLANLAAGIYTVTVTDNNGLTATASYVVVEPAEIIIKFSMNQNCGINGKLDALVQGGSGLYEYEWKNGTGGIINSVPGFPNQISAKQCSTYVIKITDENSCVAQRTFMVPKVSITQPTNCVLQANLTCSADFGSASSYQWNGNSSLNTNPLNCISSGNYQVLISNANGDNVSSCSKAYTVKPFLITGFNNVPSNRLAVLVSGGCKPYTATWTISGGITPTIYPYTPVANGKIKHLAGVHTYSVTVTDDCGHVVSNTFSPRFAQVGSELDPEISSGITVFPNPSTGIFTISFNDDLQNEKSDVSVYNSTGKLVIQTKDEVDQKNEIQIDLTSLPKGIYCIRASVKGKPLSKNVVIE